MSKSRSPSKRVVAAPISRKTSLKPAPLAPKAKPRRLSRASKLVLVEQLIERFRAETPEPRCELYYETPFQLLVSVALSAQATDKSVNQAMRAQYEAGFTADTVLALGEAGFLARIRSIGLAPTKAKNVHKLAGIVKANYGGDIPRTREELEALPGVGRKTANVILGEIYREPTIAVDTHVFRVSRRLGLHDEATPEKCEQVLLDLIDKKHLPDAHHWLILHGRYRCKAVKPDCEGCPVKDLCPSL